jgi:hypothetical protein
VLLVEKERLDNDVVSAGGDSDVTHLLLPFQFLADFPQLGQRHRDPDDRRQVHPDGARGWDREDVDQPARDQLRHTLADRRLRDVQLAGDLGVRPPPVGLKDLDHPAVDLVQDLVLGPAPAIDIIASVSGRERDARPSGRARRAVHRHPFLRPNLDV